MRRGAEWDWERVVPMLGKGGRTGKSPGYAVLHHVRAYWDGLRGTDLVPRRTLIEPHGLHDALAHVFLIERIAPGLARFRLAGTHMTNLMGMEVRGMPLSAILAPASRDGARALVEASALPTTAGVSAPHESLLVLRALRLVRSRAAEFGSASIYVDYAATKGAIDTLTKGLARELMRHWHRLDIARGLHRFEQRMLDLLRAYALAQIREHAVDPSPARAFILINSIVFTLLRYLSLPSPAMFEREELIDELAAMAARLITAPR